MSYISSALRLFGFNPSIFLGALTGLPKFYRDYKAYLKQQSSVGSDFPISRLYPVLTDHLNSSGVASGDYFHQDLHVARRVLENNPRRHLDIASRVDGLVSHLAVFRCVDVADIRPLKTSAKNISFLQSDIMRPDVVDILGKADSVSCLHAIEHFGLGRYGDPIQIDGHILGINNVASLVEKGGTLYLSVPIGSQRTEFNGHRVFSAGTLPKLLDGIFVLERFSFVDDAGEMHHEVDWNESQVSVNFGCQFGLGIYEFYRMH